MNKSFSNKSFSKNQNRPYSLENIPISSSVTDALTLVGDHHRYQYRVFIILALLSFISTGVILIPAFVLKKPEFLCGTTKCTEDNGGCIEKILHPNEHITMTTDFELYCENRTMRDVGQSLFFLGALFGSFYYKFLIGINFFSMISDNKGRIVAIRGSVLTVFIGICGYNLSSSIAASFLFSFLCGNTFSFFILMFVMVSEISNSEFRQKAGVCLNLFAALGEIYFVVLAYSIKQWRVLVAVTVTVPLLVIFFPLVYFVKESPKYLWTKKPSEAVALLNHIAKVNKKPQLSDNFMDSMLSPANTALKDKRRIYSFRDLFRYRSIRPLTIGASILFFTIQVAYYGTEFAIADLGGNLYFNSVTVAIAETISYIITIFTMQQMKRKKTLMFCTILTAVFSLGFFFVKIPEDCKKESENCPQKILETFLISMSRLVNGVVYAIIFTYIPELFPVTVKSLGFGFSKFFGIMGVILSPMLVDFADRIHLKPMIMIGIVVILGIPAILMLKETLNKEIPDEIIEIEMKRQNTLTRISMSNIPNVDLSADKKNNEEILKEKLNVKDSVESLEFQNNSTIKY